MTTAPYEVTRAIEDLCAGKNDKDNFRLVYDFYRPKVFRFLCHKKIDPERADDLTQETFLRVYKNIGDARLQYAESFDAWLVRIAANLVIDEYRRNSRRGGSEISLDETKNRDGNNDGGSGETLGMSVPDSSPAANIEGQLLEDERRRRLLTAIKNLAPMQQKCLTLHVYQEKTASEIALLLHLKEGTVKAHIHQARENLKKMLMRESGV
jgi:RNA polymerase sigma-70 factor, ECF subfamily